MTVLLVGSQDLGRSADESNVTIRTAIFGESTLTFGEMVSYVYDGR